MLMSDCSSDVCSSDLRAPLERLLDLMLDLGLDLPPDLGCLDARLKLDQVCDALHAFHMGSHVFGSLSLVIPFDLALERHPSILDGHPDVLRSVQIGSAQCRDRVCQYV